MLEKITSIIIVAIILLMIVFLGISVSGCHSKKITKGRILNYAIYCQYPEECAYKINLNCPYGYNILKSSQSIKIDYYCKNQEYEK